MRKQKASDRRTARLQRGLLDDNAVDSLSSKASLATQILSSTPINSSQWKHKKIEFRASGIDITKNGNVAASGGGRGRARKRLKLYNSLALYHATFLELISEEYRVEVSLSFAFRK